MTAVDVPVIERPRLRLREWRWEDIDELARIWGRGLATEGGAASIRYGFEVLGFDRIISITDPDNAASRRVMEKLGLTHRGQRFWRDGKHVWDAIERDRWQRG